MRPVFTRAPRVAVNSEAHRVAPMWNWPQLTRILGIVDKCLLRGGQAFTVLGKDLTAEGD